jgi:hypothetical protein
LRRVPALPEVVADVRLLPAANFRPTSLLSQY